jgi:hypothetical protein
MNSRSTRIALYVGALGGLLLMSPAERAVPRPGPRPRSQDDHGAH